MTLGRELLDWSAHASMAFMLLVMAWSLGCSLTPLGAISIGWACGFVREFTEWQNGINRPFSATGLLDQSGWIFGSLCFVLLTGAN